MTKKTAESLFTVTLADGTILEYPATFTASYAGSNTKIRMLPLTVGVEAQVFALIGELLDAIPDLENIVNDIFRDGWDKAKLEMSPGSVVTVVRAALFKSPEILIRLGAAMCELDEDGVRQKLTLAELIEMAAPAVFLEKYRFETSFGSALERLGYDLDAVDEEVIEDADEG